MSNVKKVMIENAPRRNRKLRTVESGDKRHEREVRFVRVATRRVNIALKYMRLLSNLTSANYLATDVQLSKIADVLVAEASRVADVLRAKTEAKNEGFSL